ncbi:MAG: helix-turn-helix domain-containing protein [Bacteroidetes bacterium]|nr:helix-turn-helix domain-containing protein [Bacteroidota bacterium]
MEKHRSYCPVNLALEVIGDKWTLLIIRDIMMVGKRHFREILNSDEKIASNILTDRLNMLEKVGVLAKAKDPSHKQKFIYSLTEMGIDLFPTIVEIGNWSLKHRPVDPSQSTHAKMLVEGGKKLHKKMMEQLKKEHLIQVELK